MTPSRSIEHWITTQLLRRRERDSAQGRVAPTRVGRCDARPFEIQPWADRVIGILALTTGLLVLGSYFEELLWAVLAASLVYTLR